MVLIAADVYLKTMAVVYYGMPMPVKPAPGQIGVLILVPREIQIALVKVVL